MLAVLVLGLADVQPARAETRDTTVIGMFPKQMVDFAYADLKDAQKYPWFDYMRHVLMPDHFKQFDQFLASIGLDPASNIETLYWGTAAMSNHSEQIVGAATGEFDLAANEAHLQAEQLPSFEYSGFTIYAFGSGEGQGDILFSFLDTETVAFGQPDALKELIDVRTGAADGLFLNEKLYPLIQESNGNALIWSVLGEKYARETLQDLIADIGQVPQVTAISSNLKAMTIGVEPDDDNGMRLDFQTVCGSPNDPNLLAAALQAGLLYQRYRTSGTNSALANILGEARVEPRGDRLETSFALSQDELESLAVNGNLLSAF